MKPKHLIILLAALAASLALVYFARQGGGDDLDEAVGKKLIPDLKTEEVAVIVLNSGKEEVTLEIKDGKWTVKGREGFPSNMENIDKLLRRAWSMEASDVKTEVAEKYLGRFKLMAPGTGGKDDETGVLVSLRKADGAELASFLIGKNPSAPSGTFSNSQAQYVRLTNAKDKVFTIKEAFDYFINDITNKAWLDKAADKFFKAEKIKSVTVTTNKPEDNWKLFREKEGTETADIKLADVKPGEEFDTAKASNSASAFGSPSFNDVATAEQKAQTGLDQPLRTAVIETFDGFTYTIKIGKQVEQKDKDPNAGASEEYFVSVDVVGSFVEKMPEEPAKPDDKRTEEEKKKAKEEAEKKFAEELGKKKEKLAREKALSSRVFIMPKFVVEPLLKNRAEFMKDKPATPPAGDATTPGTPTPAPGTPPGTVPPVSPATTPKKQPITATTPPIEVTIPLKDGKDMDGQPKFEVKPVPPPAEKPANPVPPKPPEAPKPTEPTKPAAEKSAEPAKPAEVKPAEPVPPKPAEVQKPTEAPKPAAEKPAEPKPAEPAAK